MFVPGNTHVVVGTEQGEVSLLRILATSRAQTCTCAGLVQLLVGEIASASLLKGTVLAFDPDEDHPGGCSEGGWGWTGSVASVSG